MVFRTESALQAGSLRTDPEKLGRMARDGKPGVRRRVAANPSCREATLARLARDKSKDVRREVALNPLAGYVTLVNLSFDRSPDVRFAVAENYGAPMAILLRMASDDINPYVRARAWNTLKRMEMMIAEEEKSANVICHMDHLSPELGI